MTNVIFRKLATVATLGVMSLGAIAATPAMARDYYPGDYYRGNGGYDRGYDRGYRNGDFRRGTYYRGGYDRGYGYNGYRGNRGYYRCRDNGTGGTIIGAIAGGLLGNEVAGRGDRTTGAVVGAAVGALAGRAIDKNNGRRC